MILLWKGGGRALYDIDADELNAQPPDTPTHWPDTGTVLTNLVADRQGWDF